MMNILQLKEDTTVFVQKMQTLLKNGEHPRAAYFLARAFCNYYRDGSNLAIDLSEIDRIDDNHQTLLFNMLLLRSYGFRGDNELHELYLLCKEQE